VTQLSALPFERSDEDRIIAGVCGGIASAIGVDATLVRLVFALLALAGGAGVLLYLALWSDARSRRRLVPIALVALAAAALLSALGLSKGSVIGAGFLVAGIAFALRRGGSIRPGGSVPVVGIILLMLGAVLLLQHLGASHALIGPGAVLGALGLVVGPWIWQLAGERTERIRLAERADVAARVHDSVLQTLALVQRHADDPGRIRVLARRQERDLRRWLYGSGAGTATTLGDALAEAATELEDLHGVPIELAASGDVPLDEGLEPLVLAAREAMANAARHSTADEISVYLETSPDTVAVYVRDRGKGFDPAQVSGDRRGISESIRGRMQRANGTASITTAPGEGTEVELALPRSRP
jgi:signal transduction histidine kinase